jgi:hypothetical protein
MLEKSLYKSILSLCNANNIAMKQFSPGEVVIDNESNHTLYLFASGWYTAWSTSPFGSIHEVGEIDAPSILGEGVFFGSFRKPIKIIAESRGSAFLLDEKNISHMTSLYPHFREMLMRACLATTNERIREANMERTIDYTLADTIESDISRSIPKMLETLKKIFSVPEILWIERHEILKDIYSVKYRSNLGITPVNEKINMHKYLEKKYIHETGFLGEGHAHIFGLISR